MIVTDIEVKDLLYDYLKKSGIVSEVSGKMYKDARPLNSSVEDIVISVLARDGKQVQSFIVNVNVYVKDVKRQNEFIEDTVRLRKLCSLFNTIFDESVVDGFLIAMDYQQVIDAPGIDYHVINNRVSVKVLNAGS